jgi:hypothetical protein
MKPIMALMLMGVGVLIAGLGMLVTKLAGVISRRASVTVPSNVLFLPSKTVGMNTEETACIAIANGRKAMQRWLRKRGYACPSSYNDAQLARLITSYVVSFKYGGTA